MRNCPGPRVPWDGGMFAFEFNGQAETSEFFGARDIARIEQDLELCRRSKSALARATGLGYDRATRGGCGAELPDGPATCRVCGTTSGIA
ncbi:MAG: hypothetical protein HOP28_12210 [Gemmatimonadales bacterium]|nr:hypothetical protein [Gemmatimonadales bacterium]